MGCDIHAYVEHRERDADSKTWWPFGGRINPGRNYDVFEKLAGVRGELSNAIVQPRGLPDDLSWESSDDYWRWISYKGEVSDCVSPEKAEQWHRYGAPYKGTVGDGDDRPRYVGDPDAHTPSWVTVDEFAQALEAATRYGAAGVQYRALLAAMRVLRQDNRDVRLVFWFDN